MGFHYQKPSESCFVSWAGGDKDYAQVGTLTCCESECVASSSSKALSFLLSSLQQMSICRIKSSSFILDQRVYCVALGNGESYPLTLLHRVTSADVVWRQSSQTGFSCQSATYIHDKNKHAQRCDVVLALEVFIVRAVQAKCCVRWQSWICM